MKPLFTLLFLSVFSLAGYAQNHNQTHQALEIEIQLNHSGLEYYKGPGGEVDLPFNEYDHGALAFGCHASYIKYFNRWLVLKAGLGYSQLNYQEKTIYLRTDTVLEKNDIRTHFIDLTLGHEFSPIVWRQWSIFLGNSLVGQFNMNNKRFDDFGLSIQSELGVRKKIRKNLLLQASINYQRWITTYGDINFGRYEFKPEWIGGGLGVKVLL